MTFQLNDVRRFLTAALAMTTVTFAAAQTQSEIHRNAATRNVGDDTFMMQNARAFYCNLPDDNNAIVIAARGTNSIRVPLTQIFDDVWIVGTRYVAQYIIKTADGFVMVDGGNNATEVQTYNHPALQSLGLSASFPLKEIFLTHGHGDHDGGAKWLLDNLGARSWLGSADAANKAYNPKLIDSTNLAPQQISIGGKAFTILATPGHTPGSTSAVLTVKDNGKDVRVLINGGQSMTSSVPEVANYLDSIERTYALAKDLQVEGVMTPHIYWDGTVLKVDEIIAKGRAKPSQFVYGNQTVLRQLAVARECSASWLTRLDPTRVLPTWRFNTVEFVGSPTPSTISARVKNGWGPLAGQPVKFAVADKSASCTAVTNNEGIATCNGHNLPGGKVSAEFAGTQTTQFVDLPAVAQAELPEAGGGCATGNGRFDPMLSGLALLAALGLVRRRNGASVKTGLLRLGEGREGALLGNPHSVVALGLLAGPLGAVVLRLLSGGGAIPTPSVSVAIHPALYMLVAAPVLEELAFRGALQDFCRAIGTRIGVRHSEPISWSNGIASIAFAACHLPYQSLSAVFFIVFPSLLLGRLREVTGAVWPCMLMHVWFNACFFTLFAR